MIFFVATPLIVGMMNFVVPLQIGARDVSFPYLNNLGFWLTAVAAMLVNISLFVGEFSQGGWVGEPPLTGLTASPGVGVDYYLWALQISGIGTTIGAIKRGHRHLRFESRSVVPAGPFRHFHLLIRDHLRRCQAENPPIALPSFPWPPLLSLLGAVRVSVGPRLAWHPQQP